METVQEATAEFTVQTGTQLDPRVQAGAFLLELSPDWIVLRASENVHRLLGESHVRLIDEPLGGFVHSEALHDLRNLFSRLSGTNGIARAYRVRLTDDPELFDVAFQLNNGRVLLEAVPSAECYGEWFGTIGGLISGLANSSGQALLDAGARRMRALTGFDRVTLVCGGSRAESSRGAFGAPAQISVETPAIIADSHAEAVSIFPRNVPETSAAAALMCSPLAATAQSLRSEGVRSALSVPFRHGDDQGEFRCESRTPRDPCLELHAAAELFAQLFAMQLEIDGLKNR